MGEVEMQESLNFVGKYSFLSSLENVKTLALKHCYAFFFPLSLLRHTYPFYLSMKYGYVILEMFWIVSWSQKEIRKAIYKSVYKMYVITLTHFLCIEQGYLKIIAKRLGR